MRNPYKTLFDGSKLRSLKYVEKLLATEEDPVLLKKLRLEKRHIFFQMFWNDKIDFEMFSKLIKGEAIWLEL